MKKRWMKKAAAMVSAGIIAVYGPGWAAASVTEETVWSSGEEVTQEGKAETIAESFGSEAAWESETEGIAECSGEEAETESEAEEPVGTSEEEGAAEREAEESVGSPEEESTSESEAEETTDSPEEESTLESEAEETADSPEEEMTSESEAEETTDSPAEETTESSGEEATSENETEEAESEPETSDSNGQVQMGTTLIHMGNNVWEYHVDGELDASYTGLTKYNGSWYYIKNGILDWSFTGLTKHNGVWYYVNSGKLDWGYTGLCKNNGIWFYVNGGMVDWSFTGLTKYHGAWFYVADGMLDWNFTGFCKNMGIWFYVNGGMVDWNFTGLAKFNGTWFYAEGGMINWSYTGLCKNQGIWFYVNGGMVDWSFTGVTKYKGGWFYVSDGMLDWDYIGLCEKNGTLYYVEGGMIDWSFTGPVVLNAERYQVIGGYVRGNGEESGDSLTAAWLAQVEAATLQMSGSHRVDVTSLTQISAQSVREMVEAYAVPNKPYLDGAARTDGDFDSVLNRRNLSAITEPVVLQYGILTDNASVRAFPTWQKLSDGTSADSFDYLQESMLMAGEGVVILHQTADRAWSFVQADCYNGWIETGRIAFCSRDEMTSYMKSEVFAVVTEPVLTVDGVSLRMGTRLPLIHFLGEEAVLQMAKTDANGTLKLVEVTVDAKQVSCGYLELSEEAMTAQARKLLGSSYGWGDTNGNMDCSSTLRAVYHCFGIILPRNTSWMSSCGLKVIDLQMMSYEEKRKVIAELPLGSILLISGHAMMYMGEENGVESMLHNVTQYKPSASEELIRPMKCVITPVVICNASGTSYVDLYRYAVCVDWAQFEE